jgi:hypothetical protein
MLLKQIREVERIVFRYQTFEYDVAGENLQRSNCGFPYHRLKARLCGCITENDKRSCCLFGASDLPPAVGSL